MINERRMKEMETQTQVHKNNEVNEIIPLPNASTAILDTLPSLTHIGPEQIPTIDKPSQG